MSLKGIIKSFLNVGDSQGTGPLVPMRPEQRVDARTVRALDAAVNALDNSATAKEIRALTDPAQDAENPAAPGVRATLAEANKLRKIKTEKLTLEEVKAEKVRDELRSNTAMLTEANRLAAQKAQEEKTAKEAQALKDKLTMENSWEYRYRFALPNDEFFNPTEPYLRKLITNASLQPLVKDCAERAKPYLEAFAVVADSKAKYTHFEWKRQLVEDMEENVQTLREGFPDLRSIRTQEDFHANLQKHRHVWRTRQQEIANQVNPILLELADALQLSARNLATKMETAERNLAFEYGIKFEPSKTLIGLAGTGFNLRRSVEINYLCHNMNDPREILFGILDVNKDWN